MEPFKASSWLLSIAMPLISGLAGVLLSGNALGAYRSLNLPFFAPPPWMYLVVWPVLYVLKGTSAYLVHRSNALPSLKSSAMLLYGIMLLLNFAWPIIFFRLGLWKLGFWVACALLWTAVATAIYFYRANKSAGLLLIPHLLWLTLAMLLNYAIINLN